ncbi:MAG TPA: uracil phosphoribosyltransferase [Opitutaceae bacterium]|nr:uracil phosphoribosyltransferase [Opitutaceae bacterium]
MRDDVQVPAAPSATAGVLHVIEHSLAEHTLTQLRNKHTLPDQFRELSSWLLLLLTLEATRNVPTREETVEASFSQHKGRSLGKPLIFLALNRHALGLAHAVAESFPGLRVGMITLDRSPDTQHIEPRFHLNNAPLLDSAKVILFEPVISSGVSASVALRLLRRSGASDVSLISFVGSLAGLSHLQSAFPDLDVWTAGVDTELDAKRGPLPGLGDFSARLYG